ncbi:glycosyltransferase family 2 protein [Novosphingobium mangrovi (ex Hu et al. 2023)]|uniref:Glycosyltransferase family 2 protein n=1 Tax=Novosphingobium mangrovi (ex Hu et al. 2023) TaxID=2930094 RepID=A0ABT0AG50_9SPHN|nr:glycosyltransferase family 2 protein [Novosphingobium mangrovi (ex Hu et al. 2023)]MCJ1962150.1 glycosyltransferase family 2 protein [Novosphingobium mangrovi (ex Hu et al. 2023)]
MNFSSPAEPFVGSDPVVSVVVPFLDEVDTLPILHQRIVEELSGTAHEIIFVDDGSRDGGTELCAQLARSHRNVSFISFRRNFGKSAALSAGFREARGDIIITMDADLQDDPAELPRFIAAIQEGADVVCGWKKRRLDPRSKTWPSKFFNAIANATFGLKLQDHNCGFKAFRAEAVADLNLYGELHRFIPALLHARGFRLQELAVQHHPRTFGKSKFGWRRFVKGALDLLTVSLTTRYAARPLHIFGAAGMFLMIAGGLVLSYLTALWLLDMGPIGDRPLLMLGVLMELFGVQLVSTGLIAELVLSSSIREDQKYLVRTRIPAGPVQNTREPGSEIPAQDKPELVLA